MGLLTTYRSLCRQRHASNLRLTVCVPHVRLQVKVTQPDAKGCQAVACVLGRGQVVGERVMVNNQLRCAGSVAQGSVQVVVLKKRDCVKLCDPLVSSMLSYDAVAMCLRVGRKPRCTN